MWHIKSETPYICVQLSRIHVAHCYNDATTLHTDLNTAKMQRLLLMGIPDHTYSGVHSIKTCLAPELYK